MFRYFVLTNNITIFEPLNTNHHKPQIKKTMQTLDAAKDKNLRQSNLITSSRYEFSLVEKRIIYLIIEKLNGLDNEAIHSSSINEGLKMTINYRPVLEVCQLWSNSENKNYAYIKDAIKSLRKREYDFEDVPCEFEGNNYLSDEGFAMISQYRIIKGTTLAQIQVPKLALKYFNDLSRNYTNYNMFNAMTLTSQYSQRLYEQCSRWKDTKWFTLHLDKLKEILNIPDGYHITEIKRSVLEVAKKELYSKTELSFTYKEKKEGKKIVAFDFTVFMNADRAKQFSTPTPPDAVVELILCLVEKLPLSNYQKKIIATSGLCTEAEVQKLIYDYQSQKDTLRSPGGWLANAFETRFGISFKKP